MIQVLVLLFYGYLLIGLIFGLYFVGWGAARLDHEAREMPVGVRLLLLPGSAALWPLLLQKLLRQRSSSVAEAKSSLP